MELNERMAAAETQLKSHNERMNRHGERLNKLEEHDVRQDAVLEKLCANQERTHELAKKNTETLNAVLTQGKTIKLLVTTIVYGVPALVSLWMALKQLGWIG